MTTRASRTAPPIVRRQQQVRIGEQHIKHHRHHDQAENRRGANEPAQKSGSRVIGTSPQNYGLQDPYSSTYQQVNRDATRVLYVDEQPDEGVHNGYAQAVDPEGARQRAVATQRVSSPPMPHGGLLSV